MVFHARKLTLSNVYGAPLSGIQATLQAWWRMYGGPGAKR